jgi:hypothetical protein
MDIGPMWKVSIKIPWGIDLVTQMPRGHEFGSLEVVSLGPSLSVWLTSVHWDTTTIEKLNES